MGRRILSVWFPRLASDLARRQRPVDGPFALVLRAGNTDHLHCLTPAAQRAGLSAGMGLSDARAICPTLVTRPADLVAEARGLRTLVRWAGRYSPRVGRDGADGLTLDITGVAHLFGGEDALRGDLAARLARAGLAVQAGIACTPGAARALARHAPGIAEPGRILDAIGDLPPVALRIDHDTATALARLGLSRIRDLAALPRVTLARRFSAGLLLRLDQALGDQAEPIAPDPEPPHFGARLTLPEPIGLTGDVMAGLARLLDRLCDRLAAAGRGARRLRLELHRVDGETALAEVGLARPMRDAVAIARLFRPAIEEVDAGFGLDALRLVATVTEPLAPRQIAAGTSVAGEDRMADLITRLGNRLGFEAVQRMLPADSHIPEKGFTIAPAAYADAAPHWPARANRPLVIFAPEPIAATGPIPPRRFHWRRMAFTTARAQGPERITPEWWLDDPAWRTGLRDYWRIDTQQGRRLWLFRTPQAPGWCVQGEFA